METIITAGGLSALLLEGIKLFLRSVVFKNPDFDFPAKFYLVALPVLNVLVIPLLALLAVEGFTMPTDWLEFAREAVRILVASLISIGAYTTAISPLKEHAERNKV